MKSIYTPNEYKHLTSDAEMIQAAVDEAAKYGATVIIPRVNERRGECLWEIDEAIVLHTGSSIVLENCYMRMQDDCYSNFFVNDATKGKWWPNASPERHSPIIIRSGRIRRELTSKSRIAIRPRPSMLAGRDSNLTKFR